MICKIEGCGRDAMYKTQQVCQKHYFRKMRYGTYELVGPRNADGSPAIRKYRTSNPAGYQKLYEPSHKLANSDGYCYEHRLVIYLVYGENLPDCEICGKPTDWRTCHIDHKDNDVTNNLLENLRPVCRGCNTGRSERSTTARYEIDGRFLTVTEWSKQPFVTVTRAQIKRRLDSGMNIKDALYYPNLTHPHKT